MTTDDGVAGSGADQTTGSCSRLFAVRLWTEDAAGGPEFRGRVLDVNTGAYCTFRDWSDLTAFLLARMDEFGRAGTERAEGDTQWLSRQI